MRINQILIVFSLVLGLLHAQVQAASPPYPASTMISGVEWDYSAAETAIAPKAAPGSDLWEITWADDGALYTGWGDGGGFGGTNSDGRVTLGLARVAGSPDNLLASNIFGGKNPATAAIFPGKPTGLLSIDGTLYMAVVEQGGWLRLKLGRSMDHGLSWTFNSTDWSSDAGWDFAEADGAFSDTTFLQFGKDYAGARDNYVYAYSQDKRASKPRYDIAMFRVPKDKLMERSAYEYFAGLDASNNPTWTTDISQRKAVFTNPDSVGWGVRVVYNAGLKRYFLTTWHADNGSWGIFDAPEPWGPWTTVEYYDRWQDSSFKFGFAFPNKWTSADGKSFVMVFSGVDKYDDWNTLKGRFIMAGGTDTSAPTAPASLTATPVSGTEVDLSWLAATDAESSIVSYNIYRDGSKVGVASGTASRYRDSGLSEASSHSYQVSATNSAGLESAMSSTVSVTTTADTQAPKIVSVAASTATNVLVVFDEPVTTTSAELTSNYTISGGISVSAAQLQPDQRTVLLTTSILTTSTSYTITIDNVSDRAVSKNIIAAGSESSFEYVALLVMRNTTPASYEWDLLETGRNVYIDRGFTYKTIPLAYDGYQYLRTANDDKYASGADSITFEVDKSVVVLVGFDQRSTTLPVWLAGWQDTGESLVTTDVSLRIYSKTFAAGKVSLGGNEMGNSMYVVLVTESAGSPGTDTGAGTDTGEESSINADINTSIASGGAGSLNLANLMLLLLVYMGKFYRQRCLSC